MFALHARHHATLAQNELFHGIHISDIPEVLRYLNASVTVYERGDVIVPLNAPVRAGVILDGEAKIAYYDDDMRAMGVDRLFKGHTIGQMGAALGDYRSQVELTAVAYTIVCHIDLQAIMSPGTHEQLHPHHHLIASNLVRSVSRHAALLHLRLRIIGQRNVRGRLRVYLNHLAEDAHDKIHIPFTMSDLAVFLNCDRSALYKEIKALKEEGVLHWHRRKVHLHRRTF